MENKESNYRSELEHEANEMDHKANLVSEIAVEYNKKANEIHEQANLIRQVSWVGSDNGNWENAIYTAKKYNNYLGAFIGIDHEYQAIKPVLVSSSSAVISGSYGLISPQYRTEILDENLEKFDEVTKSFDEYFERQKFRDQVINHFRNLGFETNTTGQKVIKEFSSAWELFFQYPKDVDNAIGILIPLREAINLTINELLRRRKRQKKVKEKLIGIGIQLKYETVPIEIFQQLESDFGILIDKLSSPKRNDLSQELVHMQLKQGTLFLYRLLSVIDKSKLR